MVINIKNMHDMRVQTLTNLYKKYGAMLYSIALQIAPADIEAAQILLTTFEKAQEQNIVENKGHSIFTTLIQLTMTTARQQLEERFNDQNLPNLFPASPLLHKILLENKSICQIRNETNLTQEELRKIIRGELNTIRDSQKENADGQLQQAAQ